MAGKPTSGTSTASSTRTERDESRMRRRFARRQWARRWGFWRPLLAVLLVGALTGFAVWAVWFSSLLGVDEVEVVGIDHLAASAVRETAGVEQGIPLVSVDTQAVARRVEAMAPVLRAEVDRRLPGTVEIRVTERTTVAVARIGGRWSGIDADGVVFRHYAKYPRGLPRVKVIGNADREALMEAAAVVDSLSSDIVTTLRRVDVQTVDHITLVLSGGRTVLWGSGEESDRKAEVLRALVLASEDLHFDVSVPGQPVTSPSAPR